MPAYLRESRHDICSHGWRWEKHWELAKEDEREHILLAIKSLTNNYGSLFGWYCRYGPSIHTRELLGGRGGLRVRLRLLCR